VIVGSKVVDIDGELIVGDVMAVEIEGVFGNGVIGIGELTGTEEVPVFRIGFEDS